MNNEKYRKFSPIILDWLKLPVNELYNINNIYNAIIIKFNIETNNNLIKHDDLIITLFLTPLMFILIFYIFFIKNIQFFLVHFK